MITTCALCQAEFIARTPYGLCPACWSRDHLREFDRWQTAIKHAQRARVPVTLTLPQWLGTVSDFAGLCAFCQVVSFSFLEMLTPASGLTWQNVVPVCRACSVHKRGSFEAARTRVVAYLSDETRGEVLLHEEAPAEMEYIAFAEVFGGVS